MAKDRLRYNTTRKHTHGASDAEKLIGITHTLYALTCASAAGASSSPSSFVPGAPVYQRSDRAADTRPVALLKWSFDDYIVEEMLPPGVLMAPDRPPSVGSPSTSSSSSSVSASPSSGSFLLRITSEGVPDPAVESWLRQHLPRDVQFHFLTPMDFVSSTVRHVWVRAAVDRADISDRFRNAHTMHAPAGPVFISEAIPVHVPATAPSFPLHYLPSLRYTVVLRNIIGSLSDLLLPLRHIGAHGFLNYTHIARHGVGTGQVYWAGKQLMSRQYGRVLQHHARSLAEFTTHVHRELPALLEALSDEQPEGSVAVAHARRPNVSLAQRNRSGWQRLAESVRHAVQADDDVLRQAKGPTGLYMPHHALLSDFVRRVADVAPRSAGGDTAQMIREAIARRVLQEKVHTLADVHFNALASLSLEHVPLRVGTSVSPTGTGALTARVGDVVRLDRDSASPDAALLMDSFEAAADHVNGALTSEAHVDWGRVARDGSMAVPATDSGESSRHNTCFKVVESEREAEQHGLTDVVLPTFGYGWSSLSPAEAPLLLPTNASGPLFSMLVKNLAIGGLGEMKLAPYPCYRPLVVRPKDFAFYLNDTHRGWEWAEGSQGDALKAKVYTDLEGIQRVESPLMRLNNQKRLVARRGLRGEEPRKYFLKPARKNGMMCVLQGTLPRGAPVTSLLREVFQITTLSPSAIFQLMGKPR